MERAASTDELTDGRPDAGPREPDPQQSDPQQSDPLGPPDAGLPDRRLAPPVPTGALEHRSYLDDAYLDDGCLDDGFLGGRRPGSVPPGRTRPSDGRAGAGKPGTGRPSWDQDTLDAIVPVAPRAGASAGVPATAGAALLGPGHPEPGPTRWRSRLALALIAVPVFVAVTLGVFALLWNSFGGAGVPRTAAPGDPAAPPRVVEPANAGEASAPLDGRAEATFDLVTDTASVRLGAADLGELLYRISTPPGANVLPRPEVRRDRVLLHLVPSGASGPGAVDIELNSRVRWDLRFSGGAAERSVDLAGARLTGVEFLGGSTRIDLTLPAPEGTLTVRMSGGANQFRVRAPAGPPTRVRLASGAGALTVDGDRRSGIARGTDLTPPGWDRAEQRFDLDLVAGVALLTVERGW
ncbi:hypothetical protein O7626_05270 [Micromonospora sp. WMMD1102]|uniref:hypothetical protein n=1 Tax=Micromonospora sp. WMMD1102 TaxID=3016105 RepID=UPI0024152A60|nr:hypothetical protein [Micromonospora sp. WMMD1102]MDG4785348.1 hypothetical protein [Micromonospora sp. WMMD1102]